MNSSAPYPSFARLCAVFRGAVLALVLVLALAGGGHQRAAAHEGHDHGPPAPALASSLKPRIAVHSDAYELVAIANGPQLTIYLDRYATNAPVADARIEIIAGAATLQAAAQPDSTYRATIPALDKPGRHELVFNIQHKDGGDLLAGSLETPVAGAATAAHVRPGGWSLTTLILIGLGALAVGLALGRSSRARIAAVTGAAVSCVLISAPDILAHGEPPGAAEKVYR